MRLITHNLLKCNARGLEPSQGYPLRIDAERTEIIPAEYNEELVKNVIGKIDFPALRSAAANLSIGDAIHTMESFDVEAIQANEAFLKELHHLLFEVHVQDGVLTCPTTARKFPVKDGIPNMLLHEDEV